MIRYRYDADIRVDGAERIVLRRNLRARERIEECRLTDVGQTDNAAFDTHNYSHDSMVTSIQAALRVQSAHGLLGALLHEYRQRIERTADGIEDHALLLLAGPTQYVIDHLRLIARMADTDAHAPEIRPDVRDGVAQSIVPAMTATQLQARIADGQIQFVVHDQRFSRRHLVCSR